ncbi:MAG: cytochrome c-type biogenesis protein CcmH [Acidobacteria bacterium]|nr:cytochrome c-type biogenesis protein CcmH [Acidobacteriota bacterium]
MSFKLRRSSQVALLSFAILASMGAGDEESRFQSLGHEMMCICGCGQILLECNHVGCRYSDRMRSELVAGLDRGDNDQLILQAFVQKYGTTVIAAPTRTGFNRLAWIMPFLALILGLVTSALIIRAWKERAAPAASARAGPSLTQNELDDFRRQAREETKL